MSKVGKKKRVQDNQALAKARYIRGSERKLNLLAQLIRGKNVQKALIDLEFSPRRMSKDVKKVLESAIANAENNHGLDVDRLFVREATVGKTLVMRRFRARARGRSASIEKPFSNITIIVEEGTGAEAPKKAKKAKKSAEKKTEKKAAKPKSEKKETAKKTPAKKKAAAKKDDSKAKE